MAVAYAVAASVIPETPSGGGPQALGGDDDAQLWLNTCDGSSAYFWLDPEDPASTPTPLANPEDVAWTAYARIEGDLPDPVVSADPAAGDAAIVRTPTFVAVDNWIGAFTEEECDGPVCVSVTATPSLSFAPGEPGSATVRCAGAGTRYEPGTGTPEAQAARPGACAHAYSMRTGVSGRPSAWPGVVTVTWELTWTSSSGGGTLPTVTRSTALPRAVGEVQAVVVGVG